MNSPATEIPVDIKKDARNYHDQCYDSLKRGQNSTRSIVSETNCSGMLNPDDPWYESLTQKIEEQRRKWEEEIERKRKEFFKLDAIDGSSGISAAVKDETFTLEQTKAAYEKCSDGLVHFRLKFDVKNFCPDDLRVSVIEDKRLKVCAKHESKTSKSANTREFSRTISLPKNIDDTKLSCSLSSDGVLLIDTPILSEDDFKSLSFSQSGQSDRNPSTSDDDNNKNFNPLFPTKGMVLRDQKFYLEIQLGSEYQPNEIDVRTHDQKVHIHARHEEKSQMKSILKEFIKEYDLPSNVDHQNVRAKLKAGLLILEAPINS